MIQGPDYPNQQLRAVSLETFFHGRFAVPNRLEQVQERFSARLPNLFVPSSKDNEPVALRPYHLRPNDHHESLAIAINQATYVSFAYPGHRVFLQNALELLHPSLEIFGVKELTRVVYRYDNEVAVTRDTDSILLLSDVLKVSLPDGAAARVHDVDLQWSRPWESGVVGGRVWVERDKLGTELLKISVFAAVQPGRGCDVLVTTAAASHKEARATFENMITDRFREFLRGITGEEEP